MYIPARLIGSVATRIVSKETDTIEFDLNKFIYNILFSDHFIMDSVRLREIPVLVKNFGFLEVRALLLSGILSLRCETYNIGLVNMDNPISSFLYQIKGFDVCNRGDYLQGCFDEASFLQDLDGYIHDSERSELVEIIGTKILNPPDQPLKTIFDSFRIELEKSYLSLMTLVQREILKATAVNVPIEEIEIEVMCKEQDSYLVRNNIERLGINKKLSHKIIGKSILALSMSHIRLFKMNDNEAFACYREDEMPILLNNFRSLSRQLQPLTHVDAFQRVIKLAGLPQLESKNGLKISKILEIRETPEWMSFKQWISTVPNLSDEEIQKELHHRSSKLFARLGGFWGTTVGHIVNIGAAYLLDPTKGLALGYLPWLANKLFCPKGHIMFLYKDYPSIFDQG